MNYETNRLESFLICCKSCIRIRGYMYLPHAWIYMQEMYNIITQGLLSCIILETDLDHGMSKWTRNSNWAHILRLAFDWSIQNLVVYRGWPTTVKYTSSRQNYKTFKLVNVSINFWSKPQKVVHKDIYSTLQVVTCH